MTVNRQLGFDTNRPIITGAIISNYFLAYLFRLQNMVLSSVLSLVFYSVTVLLSTILCYFPNVILASWR